MGEIWVDIKGHEGFYQISNHGNVRTLDRLAIQNKHKTVYVRKGKQLKPTFNTARYYQIGLHKNNRQETYRIHTLVANEFLEKGENHTQVNHKDGNKLNNHVSNLEWCTPQENLIHAFDTGLHWYGEESKLSKLTEKEVLQIVELRLWGLGYTKIGRMFDVHYNTIRSITRGAAWHRLTGIKSKIKPERARYITYYKKELTK